MLVSLEAFACTSANGQCFCPATGNSGGLENSVLHRRSRICVRSVFYCLFGSGEIQPWAMLWNEDELDRHEEKRKENNALQDLIGCSHGELGYFTEKMEPVEMRSNKMR